jgi:tetratricopeptide (TPR) repeat protein
MALEGLFQYRGPPITRSPVWQQWAERADRYAARGTIERVYADLALGRVRLRERRWTEFRDLRVRAVKLARELNQPEALIRAVTELMSLPTRQHEAERLRLVDEFVAIPREGLSMSTLGRFLGLSQIILIAAGERARAEELWRELEQLASRTQDAALLLWPLTIEGFRSTLDGNLEAVVEIGKRIGDRADELGSPLAGRVSAEHLSFRPLLYLGRAEEALAILPEAERQAGVQVFSSTNRFGWSALCLARMGRSDEALSLLSENLRQMSISTEEDDISALILATLLETAVLAGDRDSAALLAKRLSGIVALEGSDRSVLNVARNLGKAAMLVGDWEAARTHYDKALDWATKIRYRPEVALTRFELAELLLTQSGDTKDSDATSRSTTALRSEAQSHLDFAITEFRAMKMQPALKQALGHKSLLTA